MEEHLCGGRAKRAEACETLVWRRKSPRRRPQGRWWWRLAGAQGGALNPKYEGVPGYGVVKAEYDPNSSPMATSTTQSRSSSSASRHRVQRLRLHSLQRPVPFKEAQRHTACPARRRHAARQGLRAQRLRGRAHPRRHIHLLSGLSRFFFSHTPAQGFCGLPLEEALLVD